MTLNTTSHVVVLGGSSGIGLAVARRAARAGAKVTIASKNPDSIERALGELPAGVTGRAVDATANSDVSAFFDGIGEFDHFVFTAGDNLRGRTLDEITPEIASEFFGLRLFRAMDAVRLAVPHLRVGGSITLTSGSAAFKGGAGWALGSAVCGATNSLVRSLAVELAPLRVNAVAPGVLRSPVWSAMAENDRENMYDALGATLPLGRIGETDDAAKAYVALMDQDYVTGTVAVVDGGTLIA
jgi:NAD(P)-dependent dehydrogenase (short-subunit alcohol dehydrogenase family)